jgi:hypothetical protein
MKHHLRPFACAAALLAAMATIAIGCGGKQTMASKSAAAYDEAKKKGIPIAAGEHGGHSNAVQPATTPAAKTDHDAMPGIAHASMPGMQHGSAATSPHAMAGMDRAAMPGMAHGSMAGIQHDGSMVAMAGMQHSSASAPPTVIAPPVTNAAIAQTQPAVTLSADEFDAPAPTAIEEAAKAASGMAHSMDGAAPPRQQEQKPPQPPSPHHHHGDGEVS